jgi:putative transposase
MARKIRIEYAGAAYHVMTRGNQGRDIYADDRDRIAVAGNAGRSV